MGLSLSLLTWARIECMGSKIIGLAETKDALLGSISFGEKDINVNLRSLGFRRSDSWKRMASDVPNGTAMEKSSSFKSSEPEVIQHDAGFSRCLPEFSSPRASSELDAAATKLQKMYRSYRTRRNLADCAVVVEELWWKALDFASLEHSSVSFFKVEKPETAASRWARARTRAAKVGKGLSKDEKAQKLALQHWLEAIDPRHRYGHNLHFYYDIWFKSESNQPFFYWLDVGDGREINLDKCSRNKLQNQCIEYLGPKERETYEVIVEDGRLVYKQSKMPVATAEGSKWIFVLSTSRVLYVEEEGEVPALEFLIWGATTSAGRLVAVEGVLKAIWPYSGHYLPTEENFKEFIVFLRRNNVDLSNVKRCSIDDDDEHPSFKRRADEMAVDSTAARDAAAVAEALQESSEQESSGTEETMGGEKASELGERLPCKWTSAAGARIGCVRDYPTDLQSKALEQVNLSPRVAASPSGHRAPVPSPRTSPKVRLSPRLQYMGIPRPTVSLTLPNHRRRC